MFERFTERARQVVVFAQDEARLLKHNYIGTEHILLGLLREEEGLAARVLEGLDVTVEEVRAQVAHIVGEGDEVMSGQIPFTPRAKKLLELALRESQSLGHNYIGTEHVLLGLVRENEGVAARILLDFDVEADTVRNDVLGMLSGPGRREHPESADPEIEELRAQKEAAIAARDFELAASLRDRERKLIRERRGELGVGPVAHTRTFTARPPEPWNPGARWQSMLVGAFLLALGLLIGWAIWG
jgi:ATP-dependent Clp protease ATP-binding subunit ClpA